MAGSVRKGIKPLNDLRKELPSHVVGEVASLRRMGRKGRAFSRHEERQRKINKTKKWKKRTPKGQKENFYFEDEVERFFRIQFTCFGAEPWRLFERVGGQIVENKEATGRAKRVFAWRVGRAVSVQFSRVPIENRARYLNNAYHFFEKFRFGDQRDYVMEQFETEAPVLQVAGLSPDLGYRVLAEITEAGAEEAMARCLGLHSELPKAQRNQYQIGPYQYGLMRYFFGDIMGLSQLFNSSKFRLFSESREGMVVNKKRAAEFRAEAVERFSGTFEFALLHTPERDKEHFLRGIINLADTMKATGRKQAKRIPVMKRILKEEGTGHWWNEEFISMLWNEVSKELKKRARGELTKLKRQKTNP